jgi:hypothetical protein
VDTATFKYMDSLGVVHGQSFDVLAIHGMDDPDRVRFVPAILYDTLDGGKETAFKGFQKIITVELRALNTNEDYLRAFLQAGAKSITYQGSNLVSEENQVVYESAEYENEWFDDFKLAKKYIIELVESTIRHVWAVRTQPADTMIGALKLKVPITGTLASPETFTTNAGKLLLTEDGLPFPVMSLLSYDITVRSNGTLYQDSKISQVGDVSQSGDNITFQLATSDIGSEAVGGGFFSDIVILMQPITT